MDPDIVKMASQYPTVMKPSSAVPFETISKTVASSQKESLGPSVIITAAILALLFLLLSSPYAYSAVNKLTSYINIDVLSDGVPNIYGLVIHALVFFVAAVIILRYYG
jgi:hypothetical protein